MRRPFTKAFLALNLALSFLLVAAPFQLPPGTARALDGSIDRIDHDAAWDAMPFLPGLAYRLGDLVCHQMESRSLLANGNQFPVDARFLAMFLAGNLGFAIALSLPDLPGARDALLRGLPRRWRSPLEGPRRLALLVGLLALALAPTALDGGVQLLTPYESTPALRLATGSLLGMGGALWIGLVFDALWRVPARLPAAQAVPRERQA